MVSLLFFLSSFHDLSFTNCVQGYIQTGQQAVTVLWDLPCPALAARRYHGTGLPHRLSLRLYFYSVAMTSTILGFGHLHGPNPAPPPALVRLTSIPQDQIFWWMMQGGNSASAPAAYPTQPGLFCSSAACFRPCFFRQLIRANESSHDLQTVRSHTAAL